MKMIDRKGENVSSKYKYKIFILYYFLYYVANFQYNKANPSTDIKGIRDTLTGNIFSLCGQLL